MIGDALSLIRSAYYSEPTGTAENAWNAALEHIEKALRASQPATPTGGEAKPVAWRHKHYPNEPWQYRESETFGTPYPYCEPLYAAPTAMAQSDERK